MSQEKLADLAEVDRKHMSSIETGKVEPGVLTLSRIAGVLETTVGQLMRKVTWVLMNMVRGICGAEIRGHTIGTVRDTHARSHRLQSIHGAGATGMERRADG
jgi:DNA-binding XRE family transcriptional regulator